MIKTLRTGWRVAVMGLLCLLIQAGCGDQQKDLTIAGTGSCQDILNKLAEAYNSTQPGYRVIIPSSIGSAGGVRAVNNNEIILGRVARAKNGSVKNLQYLPFAHDAIVFLTGSGTHVKSLTEKQIIDLYEGKITDWRELGGTKAPVRLLFREEIDTSLAILRTDFPGFNKLTFNDKMKLVYLDPEMLPVLAQYPSSIGWLTKSSVRPEHNVIALNGIEPTAENLASGKYPYAIEYAFIYKEGRLNESAQKFIDFVFSGPGQKILERNGMLPLKRR